MFPFTIAWRNLWRNPLRTAITGAAIALNTATLIVTAGLIQGMLDTLQHSLTATSLGEVQVHAPAYRAERKLRQTVGHPDAILAAAAAAQIDATQRSFGAGLAAVGSKSSGAVFWGIEPARERAVFELPRQIARGRFLADPGDAPAGHGEPAREVVLGAKLASALEADVGSELVAVVEAADGSIGNDLFRVVGVLKTVSSDVDRSAALVSQRDFSDLFATGGAVHEIALTAHGTRPAQALVEAVTAAAAGDEVATWRQLAPGPAQMSELFGAMTGVLALIFGLVASAGVMNTVLMSTFERTHELGVLKALGATPLRVVRDIAAEALLLGVVFGAVGAALGAAASQYLAVVGIDLATGSDLMLSGVAFEPVWRARFSVEAIVGAAAFMATMSVLAALMPAIKAARLDPVAAMNEP
jgi:ABC-type lipoprotein release transport system permease subunit